MSGTTIRYSQQHDGNSFYEEGLQLGSVSRQTLPAHILTRLHKYIVQRSEDISTYNLKLFRLGLEDGFNGKTPGPLHSDIKELLLDMVTKNTTNKELQSDWTLYNGKAPQTPPQTPPQTEAPRVTPVMNTLRLFEGVTSAVVLKGYVSWVGDITTSRNGKEYTKFGLNCYAGKDETGKAMYTRVNLSAFDEYAHRIHKGDYVGVACNVTPFIYHDEARLQAIVHEYYVYREALPAPVTELTDDELDEHPF